MPPATDLSGADDYMTGLTQFAQGVVPGGAASVLAAPVGSDSYRTDRRPPRTWQNLPERAVVSPPGTG